MIDAHQHFWRIGMFDTSWMDAPRLDMLRQDHLPVHLAPQLSENAVRQTIAVQTQHDVRETCWLLELAAQYEFIAGVVGWVDLVGDCEAQLEEWLDEPKFVGVRHRTRDEPRDDFILRDDVMRGLKVLERHQVPFELVFSPVHLPHAARLARRLPDLPMVLDHLAEPAITDRVLGAWRRDLRAAAEYPNVYCKLSGLVTQADWQWWTPADLAPYVHEALDAFGSSRCMFGSDWPTCRLAASYGAVLGALRDALGDLSSEDATAIFGGTAREFYRLGS